MTGSEDQEVTMPCIYINIYIYICDWWISSVLFSSSPSAGAALPLAVEVNGGNRQAEVVQLGEVPGVEVLAPPRRVNCLPPQLTEQYQDEPVDSHRRPGALVAHHLLPCKLAKANTPIPYFMSERITKQTLVCIDWLPIVQHMYANGPRLTEVCSCGRRDIGHQPAVRRMVATFS